MIFALQNMLPDESGCWLWQGALSHNGYAITSIKGKSCSAHRLAYKIYCGEIPHGKQLDHLCRVRRCINPKHLEIVSPKENILRGINHVAANAIKTHCCKGHEFTEENLLKGQGNHRRCKICHRERGRLRRANAGR